MGTILSNYKTIMELLCANVINYLLEMALDLEDNKEMVVVACPPYSSH